MISPTVLLLEPDTDTARRVEAAFQASGHSVMHAGSPAEARELVRTRRFEVVVTTASGIDLAAAARSGPSGDGVFLFFLADPREIQGLREVLSEGPSDFIARPIHPSELEARVAVVSRLLSAEPRTRRSYIPESTRAGDIGSLQQSEERLRTLIAESPIGILLYDEAGRPIEMNPAAMRIFGVTDLAQIPHLHDGLRIFPEPALVEQALQRLARGETIRHTFPVDFEWGIRELHFPPTSKKGVIYIELCITPLGVKRGGRPTGYLAQVQDITDRRLAEARLFVADRMASLGTMAAGVAHEINNPLSYVMANVSHVSTELARRAAAAPDEYRELVEALDEALVGVDRIRRIVADLKTFSRPDDDGAVTLDVRRVLDSCANMAQNEIRHRAKLSKEYAVTPPVRGSDARLGQVFLNLLVNAAQAIPLGHASENEILLKTYVREGGRVEIEVTDTGPGIPPEVLPKIFDPFFTTKSVGEGTGLGLSICHAIVKALGGEIAVDTAVGRGTTMRVSLPSVEVRVEDVEKRRTSREPVAPKRRILVVDDEPLFGTAIRRLLQGEHDVTLVMSGREAVRLLGESEFDMVLCDLMMPEVSGIDVYNEVRRDKPGFERRIAFMTGGAFTAAARQFLDGLPNPRLDKPFTKEEIRALIMSLLSDVAIDDD
ncbi:MAG TPA: ATP-binding protein [Polyangiaceae bacterium]|nr:ATP-binding protein [Polyangiaceae bacterium]